MPRSSRPTAAAVSAVWRLTSQGTSKRSPRVRSRPQCINSVVGKLPSQIVPTCAPPSLRPGTVCGMGEHLADARRGCRRRSSGSARTAAPCLPRPAASRTAARRRRRLARAARACTLIDGSGSYSGNSPSSYTWSSRSSAHRVLGELREDRGLHVGIGQPGDAFGAAAGRRARCRWPIVPAGSPSPAGRGGCRWRGRRPAPAPRARPRSPRRSRRGCGGSGAGCAAPARQRSRAAGRDTSAIARNVPISSSRSMKSETTCNTPAPVAPIALAMPTSSSRAAVSVGVGSPVLVRWFSVREVVNPSAPAVTASAAMRPISAISSGVAASRLAPRSPIT